MQRLIHIYCDGGFGNRFNCLISGLLLAKSANLRPIIVWPINNWCGAHFFDLFENEFTILEKELIAYKPEKDNFHFFMTEDHLNLGVPNKSPLETRSLPEAIAYLGDTHSNIFYHTPLIPNIFSWNDLKDQINLLKFNQEITLKAENFLNERKLHDFFGVQIRKTDFGQNGADENNLFELISNCNHKRFFVCSDDKDVESRFNELENVETYPKRAHVEKLVEGGWNTATPDYSGRVYACNVNRSSASVEDALVDLLILSHSQIVKTSNSTFLNTALIINQVRKNS